MGFEWDEEKSQANLEKHGLSFDEARKIFEGVVLTAVDSRRDYGEKREVSIGVLGKMVVVVVVHTKREGRVRIISSRKANRQEREKYYEYLKKTT